MDLYCPDRHPRDPGYVHSAEAVTKYNKIVALVGDDLAPRLSVRFRPRPWSFPAYTGPIERPRRIGPST